ncbi:hypothetical protein [Prosthecobacter sp.]|uniref:hypothetical protein n=1 Tax=Prosthecobacter sp. TaxID=1965333 RepID=UPI003783E818
MKFTLPASVWQVLLLFLASAFSSSAQDQYRIFAPAKDVAMLVDVSVSVKSDRDGHEDAKKIIQSIVSGRGFKNQNLNDKWVIEANPEMIGLFGAYLGQPPAAGTAELRPLLADNSSFLTMRIGTVQTVLTSGTARKLKTTAELDTLIESTYPKTGEMNDKSTCFWLAMARAAGTLSQQSRLGYYLFVVSDEEDDPDYRKEGPPGHTASDYKAYTETLAKTYPETAIRGEIARYFDFIGPNARKVEMYRARSDFKQILIAKFFQSRGRSSKKVSLAWYAMGVVPQRVRVPRVPTPPPVVLEQPGPQLAHYEAPRLQPAIQWLGGIAEVNHKRFDYPGPLLVWQVKNAEASGFDSDVRPVVQVDNQSRRNRKMISSRHDQQTWPLPADLDPGDHEIILRHASLDSESNISIRRSSYFWLYTLAIISVALALGVFILSWRTLRQSRPARAAL